MGVPNNRREPHLFPLPMPWIRDLAKSKRAAPPAVPIEMPLRKDPDATLTRWL